MNGEWFADFSKNFEILFQNAITYEKAGQGSLLKVYFFVFFCILLCPSAKSMVS